MHVEECSYGYSLNLLDYTEEQLKDRIERLLNDEDMKIRLKNTSERIRNSKKIEDAAQKLVDFLSE